MKLSSDSNLRFDVFYLPENKPLVDEWVTSFSPVWWQLRSTHLCDAALLPPLYIVLPLSPRPDGSGCFRLRRSTASLPHLTANTLKVDETSEETLDYFLKVVNVYDYNDYDIRSMTHLKIFVLSL